MMWHAYKAISKEIINVVKVSSRLTGATKEINKMFVTRQQEME